MANGMNNFATSYEEKRERANEVALALREIATLIGPRGEPYELDDGQVIDPGLGMHEAETLAKIAAKIEQGVFTIVVVGEFNAGKSTLLNALLGDSFLLTRIDPTTGVITMLVYGKESKVVRVYWEGREEPDIYTIEDFQREFNLNLDDTPSEEQAEKTEKFRYRLSGVRYAEMDTPLKFCEQGVKLVDSPGLGDHSSRTQLTANFLAESQAVVMVLSALRLLGEQEREFISEHLGMGRRENAFFIVNRANQVDEEDWPQLHKLMRRHLKPLFANEDGEIDEDLYAERVFFLDALGALRGRQKNDPARVEKSNVPSFEGALQGFLTEETLFQMTLRSSIEKVVRGVRRAEGVIKGQKKAIELEPAELRTKREAADTSLKQLRGKVRDIQMMIQQAGSKIQYRLEGDLQNFLYDLSGQWTEAKVAQLKGLDNIKTWDIGKAIFKDRKAQAAIAAEAKKILRDYFSQQFSTWLTTAEGIVKTELDELEETFQEQLKEFALELQRVQDEFLAVGEKEHLGLVGDDIDLFKSFRMTLLLGGEGLVGSAGGIFRRLMIVGLTAVLFSLTPFGWYLLIASLIFEVGADASAVDKFRVRIVRRAGETLFESLRADLTSTNFMSSHFPNFIALVDRLRTQPDPFWTYLWQQLPQDTRESLSKFKSTNEKQIEPLSNQLAEDLSKIVNEQGLEELDWSDAPVLDETHRLWGERDMLDARDRQLLNRLLLVAGATTYTGDDAQSLINFKLRDLLHQSVRAQFIKEARKVTKGLDDEINEVQKRMDDTIAQLESAEFSADAEEKRLDDIHARLFFLLSYVSEAVYGEAYDLETLEKMTRGANQ